MKKITVIAGTRPEIIKIAPILRALKDRAEVRFITTGQHDEMAAQALSVFSLEPDKNLAAMIREQTPSGFIAAALPVLDSELQENPCDVLIAQGDTASTFVAALCSFHAKIPFAHIEAGLRTGNLLSPFPEEAYRSMISRITAFHFCPTPRAASALRNEGIVDQVYTVGNTVVDALLYVKEQLSSGHLQPSEMIRDYIATLGDAPLILVTGHRRENHDEPMEILCKSLRKVATEHPRVQMLFPVHLNPKVSNVVHASLSDIPNITLCEPLDYVSNIAILNRANLAVSDSGGIQEEAPYCNTFVLITREHTERPEVPEQGLGELLPLRSVEQVSNRVSAILANTPSAQGTPYGDGTAAIQIRDVLL